MDIGADVEERLIEVGMHNISPVGILGDPTQSTAAAGEEYIRCMANTMAEQVREILSGLKD